MTPQVNETENITQDIKRKTDSAFWNISHDVSRSIESALRTFTIQKSKPDGDQNSIFWSKDSLTGTGLMMVYDEDHQRGLLISDGEIIAYYDVGNMMFQTSFFWEETIEYLVREKQNQYNRV